MKYFYSVFAFAALSMAFLSGAHADYSSGRPAVAHTVQIDYFAPDMCPASSYKLGTVIVDEESDVRTVFFGAHTSSFDQFSIEDAKTTQALCEAFTRLQKGYPGKKRNVKLLLIDQAVQTDDYRKTCTFSFVRGLIDDSTDTYLMYNRPLMFLGTVPNCDLGR